MRRPVFWFLWPAGDPGPVDAAAVQSRWLRVCPRGPWRWAFLLTMSAVVVITASAAFAAALADPGWVTLLLSAVIVVPLVALLARAWVAGTYVCDRGIKVSSVLRTEVVPWTAVGGVTVDESTRLLGTPLRIRGQRLTITGPQPPIATHIETASPDLWLRPQAWAAASDRVRTWLRETR